jgi:hypothetical protein
MLASGERGCGGDGGWWMEMEMKAGGKVRRSAVTVMYDFFNKLW